MIDFLKFGMEETEIYETENLFFSRILDSLQKPQIGVIFILALP